MQMRSYITAAASVFIAVGASAPALAQSCTPALKGPPTGPVVLTLPSYGNVVSISDVMPYTDVSGTSLIIGGHCSIPPSSAATLCHVARYQNAQWTAFPAIVANSDSVFSLAQADFSSVGGPSQSIYAMLQSGIIRRWNGSTWVPTGTIPAGQGFKLLAHTDANGPVLLAAGSYASGVYAWRGSGSWTPYAPLTVSGGQVVNLKAFDDGSGPALFAMGAFIDNSRNLRFIIKLVNGVWEQYELPASNITSVSDITRFDDGANGSEVYVCGGFMGAARRKRSGTWQPVGSGVTASDYLSLKWSIIDEGAGPQLYLGGSITGPVPDPRQGLLKWTAAGWVAPAFFNLPGGSTNGVVDHVFRFDDGGGERTYFAGLFGGMRTNYAAPFAITPAASLARLVNGQLEPMSLGLGEPLSANPSTDRYCLSSVSLPEGPALIASGPFTRAGGRFAYGAASFDGTQWTAMSGNTAQQVRTIESPTVATIAGQPRVVARYSLGNIVYWNGSEWVDLPSQTGSVVYRMVGFNDELGLTLYAGTESGLRRFNGATWELLPGTGFTSTLTIGDLGAGPRLFLGGNGPQGLGVYEWNGATATRLGAMSSAPGALIVHNDGTGPALFAAGTDVLRWNGTLWQSLGVNQTVSDLASYDDGNGAALYACGTFTVAGTQAASGLALWRNNTWSRVVPASGFNPGNRSSMAVFNDRLYIAGNFTSLSGIPADHLAWIEPCLRTCTADFNGDGDAGTDGDIEAFFACLAGSCCPRCTADFNADGDVGTDADIESFFRVLAGNPC